MLVRMKQKKKKTLNTAGGHTKCVATLEYSLSVSQKLKN